MSLATWLARWDLTPEGAPFHTHSSDLQPVRWQGQPAMLKLARVADEAEGGRLMAWWAGDGAAAVLASEPPALLLARAEDKRSLPAMAAGGEDDAATRILCAVAARLHAPRTAPPPPSLIALEDWFQPLLAERWDDPQLSRSADTARALLATATTRLPLHGDLHHDNVLDFGDGGWRAIDPKGLLGDPGFDYANLLVNPLTPLATAAGRLARQATVIAAASGLPRRRLLEWTLAFTGLSSVWILQDGQPEDGKELAHDRAVGALAAAELDGD